jgi:hypothetical protein
MSAPHDPTAVPLEAYTAYLDDLGRLGGRHETLRQFYLSVVSALFVFLALAGGTDSLLQNVRGFVVFIGGGVGVLVCIAWILHMGSFGNLFEAKTATLVEMEKALEWSVKPFEYEGNHSAAKRRRRLTNIDRFVASIFIVLFSALTLFTGFVDNAPPSSVP